MAAPKLRFKEFSKDWGSKKIIELADYVDYRGKTPKKVESGVLLVTAKNIKQGYLDYSASQEFIEESAFDDVMRRGKVELNDVLITTEAPLGNVASVDRTDIALAQRVIKYRGKIGLLDNLFLKQKFLSESFQEILKSKATGGTVQGIKGSVLHQIPLIVPSKEEQTKIASFLSAVDEKISQLTQKHELLSQYKQGMMQKLFSQQIRFKADDGSEFGEWVKKTIGEIGEVITGKTPSTNNPNAWNGDILFVTPTDMNGNKYQTTTIRTVANSHPKILPQNAIMFTCIASIGKMSLSVKPCITNQQINSVVVKKDQPEFIYYQLLNMVDYIKSTQANTTLPIINKTEFSKFILKIPQYAEQTKIANFLSAIDQKIEVVAQQIEQAKTWKKGLLQQMFI